MGLFVSILFILLVSTLLRGLPISITKMIRKTVLKLLFNSWSPRVWLLLLNAGFMKLHLKQIAATADIIMKKSNFVGVTLDRKKYARYASLENENTSIWRRGILETKHEKYLVKWLFVIKVGPNTSTLSQPHFSINNLLVNCG